MNTLLDVRFDRMANATTIQYSSAGAPKRKVHKLPLARVSGVELVNRISVKVLLKPDGEQMFRYGMASSAQSTYDQIKQAFDALN